jgi:hypothetical protein
MSVDINLIKYANNTINWKLTTNEFLDIDNIKIRYNKERNNFKNYNPHVVAIDRPNNLFTISLNSLIETYERNLTVENGFSSLYFNDIISNFLNYLNNFEGRIHESELEEFHTIFIYLLKNKYITDTNHVVYFYNYLYEFNYTKADKLIKSSFDSIMEINKISYDKLILGNLLLFRSQKLNHSEKIIKIISKYFDSYKYKKRVCEYLENSYIHYERLAKYFSEKDRKRLKMEFRLEKGY